MNIYHLKYFLDAAKYQSVSLAAKENLVSHSAVSQAIKSLEDHFEVNLIFHSKRRFQLTPEGELCLIEGQRLLEQLSELKTNLQSNRKEVRGNLYLWAPQSLIVDSLYKSLDIYQKKYPKVNISIKPGAAAQVRSAILSGEGHLGLLLDDGYVDQFQSSIIKSGNFILVDKNKKQQSYLTENSEIIVTSSEKIEVLSLKKYFKNKFKTNLKIKMEVMSWGVIKNLVEKNFGMGYVPDYCVEQEIQSGKLIKIETSKPLFNYSIAAIWAPNKQIHPNAQLFVDVLKQIQT